MGAGAIGLSTAITLAETGYPVVIGSGIRQAASKADPVVVKYRCRIHSRRRIAARPACLLDPVSGGAYRRPETEVT
jgi:hypothetical protein